jgi:small GTP-binding protein
MHRTTPPGLSARKVVLLGNSGVGKTSLAQRWIGNDFEASITPTIGPTNSTLQVDVDGRDVKITLWDTAGQEQFRSIVPLYIRGARSAILVASVDHLESFSSIPIWLDLLNSAQEEPVRAVLAINKTDLKDPLSPDLLPLYEHYKGSFVASFFVSALTGDNVEHLFRHVARIAARARCDTDSETTATPVDQEEPKNSCC